ncbi:MAG: OmpA family protein [bacterium]|nr:OmpA family protein [bacterium]
MKLHIPQGLALFSLTISLNLFFVPCIGQVQETSTTSAASTTQNEMQQPDSAAKNNGGTRSIMAPASANKPSRAVNTTTYAIAEHTNGIENESTSELEKNTVWKKGMVLYNTKAYSEAIPYFEKVRLTDSTNALLLTKLGDCYRLTNNTQGKLSCYGAMIRNGNAQPIQELYYGQALVENDEAEAARPYFEKYGADSRGKDLASSFGKTKSYTRNADAYSVVLASFNSLQNDMCAIKFNNSIVFASSRPTSKWIGKNQGWTNGAYMNVWATEKDEKGLEKKPVIFLKDLNTKYNDGPICFNKDLYMIYYTTNSARKAEHARDGSFKLRILEGEFDQGGLISVKLPSFNNKEYNFAHPSLSPNGYTIYFSSDKDGGLGGMDIYMSKKDSSGVWGPAINLGSVVNTAGNEVFPFISPTGLLYFSSNGHDGMGGLDIYESKLKEGKPARIYNMGQPINSRFDDFGFYLSADSTSGFISSNRKAGGMDDDIYNLQIIREVRRGKDVLITTIDKESGLALANTKLLINKDTVFANEKGEYLTMVEEGDVLRIKSLKEDYFNVTDSVASDTSLTDAFTKQLVLEKNPKLFLRALITDAKTNELLEGVTVKVIDMVNGSQVDLFTTTEGGDYFRFLFNNRIGDKLTYLVKLDKPGYLQRSVIFSHTITKPGEVNMNESVNLSLGKIEVGMDLAKMVDLKPIYFDLAKSTIRKDAAEELDKIVEVMNEYPEMYVELGSHTDCRSSAASNLKLSTARAQASVDYIVKRGINKARIVGKGYGEGKLLNNCACEGSMQSTCTEEEHSVNRRTEFLITKLK